MIFDTTMLIAGVLLLAGVFGLWRLYRDPLLTVIAAMFGAGTLGSKLGCAAPNGDPESGSSSGSPPRTGWR
jgi:hypothetical protein